MYLQCCANQATSAFHGGRIKIARFNRVKGGFGRLEDLEGLGIRS